MLFFFATMSKPVVIRGAFCVHFFVMIVAIDALETHPNNKLHARTTTWTQVTTTRTPATTQFTGTAPAAGYAIGINLHCLHAEPQEVDPCNGRKLEK
jgi:hypothetical protein